MFLRSCLNALLVPGLVVSLVACGPGQKQNTAATETPSADTPSSETNTDPTTETNTDPATETNTDPTTETNTCPTTETTPEHETDPETETNTDPTTCTPAETTVEVVVPDTFNFNSALPGHEGESSVSYTGQIARHVLITELVSYIAGLTSKIDGGESAPATGDTLDALNFFYEFDSDTNPTHEFALSTGDTTPTLQANLDEISTGKKLKNKMAGEDYDVDFHGWSLALSEGADAPGNAHDLMQGFFGMLDQLATDRANGEIPNTPEGQPIASVFLNANGHDLKQLIQKFALGAITLSQGLGDYLYNIEGKDNIAPYKGTKNHTAMEHNWDEAYGYFGAARDYADYTDDEIAGKATADGARKKYHDTNADGKIDLTAEYNFGNSVNAAKRDRGSSTDFTADAFTAWKRGRAIITAHVGTDFADWTDAMKADFRVQVNAIQAAWEGAVAATVIHYINDVLDDMSKFGTADYSYANHAKHWGELKGFALGLQFNPWSPLHGDLPEYCYSMTTHQVTENVSKTDCEADGGIHTPASTAFVRLHNKIGDAPILSNNAGGASAIMGYQSSLGTARTIIKDAFGFSDADVTDW